MDRNFAYIALTTLLNSYFTPFANIRSTHAVDIKIQIYLLINSHKIKKEEIVYKLSNFILLIHPDDNVSFGDMPLRPLHVNLLHSALIGFLSYHNLVIVVVTFILLWTCLNNID